MLALYKNQSLYYGFILKVQHYHSKSNEILTNECRVSTTLEATNTHVYTSLTNI